MKNNLKFTGVVTSISQLRSGTSNNGKSWQSQSVVITEHGQQYPQALSLDAIGDKCDLISGLKVGQFVTVHLNVSVRDYQGKWYNNLNIWKVEHGTPAAATAAPTSAPTGAPAPAGLPVVNGPESSETVAEDDLPF